MAAVAALVLGAAHAHDGLGRTGPQRLLLVREENANDSSACSQRQIYLDLGANWANTLRLFEQLAPPERHARPWEVYAFEASPLIQPYVDAFSAWLNGELQREPLLCLPRSGSTGHLVSYAAAIGCAKRYPRTQRGVRLMRVCMFKRFDKHLRALKPDPALNSSALVESRLAVAQRPLVCNATRSRFTLIPAAVGDEDGWMSLESPPHALIRGGAMAKTPTDVINEYRQASPWYRKEDYEYRVRTADVASWMVRSFAGARQFENCPI
jgi:hypothetical protein